MKKYAFIDVQNTETTTLKVSLFALDHEKLFLYLKDKWKCEKTKTKSPAQIVQSVILKSRRE